MSLFTFSSNLLELEQHSGVDALDYKAARQDSSPIRHHLAQRNPQSTESSVPSHAVNVQPQREYGSFDYDSRSAKYNTSWDSWEGFLQFLELEQRFKCIELRRIEVTSGGDLYRQRTRYACARHGTGGQKDYTKQNPHWARKISSKLTNCQSKLTVKTYHETPKVLGIYHADHNHDIGVDNIRFTWISNETRQWIAGLVRMVVNNTRILEMAHGKAQDDSEGDSHRSLTRNDFIVLADIRRIQKGIQAETERLHPDDGRSALLWADTLRTAKSLLGFKSRHCAAPLGSHLAPDMFTFMLQTPEQRATFARLGVNIIFIDGTHNITMYENMVLTSVLVRDEWGHGLPIAWMIASSGTEETLSYFLFLLRRANPSVTPRFIMTDRDIAQINACEKIYPESTILLCWWHVLHAWQQHFVISQHPVLWQHLKALPRITDSTRFMEAYGHIKDLAPAEFLKYFTDYWLPERFLRMWSGVYRVNRLLLELSETNMLAEAWHHILKGKFLEGRRNRRVDHLIYVLVRLVLPYFAHKQLRQQHGFEGDNLEVRKRKDIELKSLSITLTTVIQDPARDARFFVESTSTRGTWYEVDVVMYTCTCLDFANNGLRYCKHMSAVQRLFPNSESGSKQVQLVFEASPLAEETAHTILAAPTGVTSTTSQNDDDMYRRLAEKFERLAAHLRFHQRAADAAALESWVDKQLPQTIDLLPTKLKLSPNLNSWPETQAVMISGIASLGHIVSITHDR